jgi:hypothetical protein
VNAYKAKQDALRAYHLERVTSKFKTAISPENARRLARLLSLGTDAEETRNK